MAWEEIEKISTLNFHVRMRECDLLKLYQYYIFDRSRQRLIVNAKPYDNDQLYVNILGNRINLNDILIGDHYKWNPEKFPKIYDGSFKDFLESFDFEAESTIYLGACFSDYELNELLEKNFAHIKRIKEEYKTNL